MSSIHLVHRHALLALATLVLASCGGGASTGDAASGGSALVGTWGNTTCYAFCTAPDCGNCDNAMTFSADGSYATATSFMNTTSNSSFPGCQISSNYSGFRYTATATTYDVVVGASAGSVVARSGCMNAGDNQAATPDPGFTPGNLAVAGVPYVVSGTTLTVGGGASALVFTRR